MFVGEGKFLFADDLVVFVAFACDEDDVVFGRPIRIARAMALCPVRLDFDFR